jgi:hypothetical protein
MLNELAEKHLVPPASAAPRKEKVV